MPRRYWENFKALRLKKGLSQEEVAGRLKIKRQGNISTRERHERGVPKPETIIEHAAALECKPRDLMRDVITEYDVLRGDLPFHSSDVQPSNQTGGTVNSSNSALPALPEVSRAATAAVSSKELESIILDLLTTAGDALNIFKRAQHLADRFGIERDRREAAIPRTDPSVAGGPGKQVSGQHAAKRPRVSGTRR